MTLQWKLNLLLTALVGVFLVTVTFAMRAAQENAENASAYSDTRSLARFAADLRTHVYSQLARAADGPLAHDPARAQREARNAISDIDVQIRLSKQSPEEAEHWIRVRAAIVHVNELLAAQTRGEPLAVALERTEHEIDALRRFIDMHENDLIQRLAHTSYKTVVAILLASAVTVLLFLAYLFVVRRWLVQPIEVLKRAAEAIGSGEFQHAIPLTGSDELSRLARRLEAMARSLDRHQRELLESRELAAIGELSTNIAHGLRNPLAAVRASVQLALRRGGCEGQVELLTALIAQIDRIDVRITQMFELSRRLDIRRKPATFAELAASTQEHVAGFLQAKNMHLAVQNETNGEVWLMDTDQIADAVSELIVNAAHHCTADSTITLRGSVTRDSGEPALTVAVVDEGVGMSPETMAKAFDLFFTSRPNGTGMGLALVRRVVEKHGGTISLSSRLAEGTTVAVTLPSTPG